MKEREGCIPAESPLRVEPTLKAILQCFYGINQLETSIFLNIFTEGEKSVKELSRKYERDGSVIYRNLKKLCKLGLVKKRKVREGVGRPYHVYSAISTEKLQEKLSNMAEKWYKRVKEVLNTM